MTHVRRYNSATISTSAIRIPLTLQEREAWSNGEWNTILKGEKFGTVGAKGNWVEIYHREGNTWKKRLDTWNVTAVSPATAATTPSPTPSPEQQQIAILIRRE
jgi:hypothetical protein